MLNLLLVDDEPDAGLLFQQKFRKEIRKGQINFKFVESGNDALKTLEDLHKNHPLLILSDINMPGMTGLELLASIKELYPDLRVMMVSAYADNTEYLDKARTLGAEDFIAKPVDFDQLKEKLN